MDTKELFLKSNVYKILISDMSANMVNHSYMLISGDTLIMRDYAKYFASTLFCLNDGTKPCFKCNNCIRVDHNNYPDITIYPKGEKGIVTEDVNEIVFDEYVLPLEGEKKVYILYDLDNATVQAQNKLLKTLEEPNKSVIFVITASNQDNVLPTIRSRSKKIVEPMLNNEDVAKYLISSGVASDVANSIASRSFGNLTLAIAHATSNTGREMIALSKEIFNKMTDSSMVLKYSTKMLEFKSDLEDLINQMLLSVRDIMVLIATNKSSSEYNLDLYNISALKGISSLCEEAIAKIKANCNPNSVVDGLLMGILEVRYKCLK